MLRMRGKCQIRRRICGLPFSGCELLCARFAMAECGTLTCCCVNAVEFSVEQWRPVGDQVTDPDPGHECCTITMCCWEIVETLQTAEHCVVFVDGSAISAHPVGLFRDLVGAAHEGDCPGLSGFWGTIGAIDAKRGPNHPDYLHWMEHHNAGMISEAPLAPNMPSTCASELSCDCRISSA